MSTNYPVVNPREQFVVKFFNPSDVAWEDFFWGETLEEAEVYLRQQVRDYPNQYHDRIWAIVQETVTPTILKVFRTEHKVTFDLIDPKEKT